MRIFNDPQQIAKGVTQGSHQNALADLLYSTAQDCTIINPDEMSGRVMANVLY